MSPDQGQRIRLQDLVADKDMVDALFQLILGRPIENDQFKSEVDGAGSAAYWIRRLVHSDELKEKVLARAGVRRPSQDFIADSVYRTPRLFEPVPPRRIIISGSCMASAWVGHIRAQLPQLEVKHVEFNNASPLEDIPTDALRTYAFQICQIPLRAILNEADYLNRPLGQGAMPDFSVLLPACKERIRRNFEASMKYVRQAGLPAFVLNFPTPQANPLGVLMPRYHGSNLVYIFEELNRCLAGLVESEPGAYFIDFDSLCATLGKRYVNDDLTSHITHGSFIDNTYWPEDINLTPHGSEIDLYGPKIHDIVMAVFNECLAAYDILSPGRKIKLVIFDLDGTLWRGVPAEADELQAERISEGWPLSLVEAAFFLKQRGVLLAIASRNDPKIVAPIWEKVYGRRFPLSNFASVKISWDDKIDSVKQICLETNILPENCLFVDDNPVEREQVATAFPGISVISGPILAWRRTLLWSAELQTSVITEESRGRAESVQQMIAREELRPETSARDYLDSLQVQVRIALISTAADKAFARVYELLNKTNQFNTTGRRWTQSELLEFVAQGGRIHAASVSDRLSDYGLTAIALQRGDVCEQMVVSCRVFGLGVEQRLLGHIAERGVARVAFRRTEKNGPSATFVTSLGIAWDNDPAEIIVYAIPSA